MSGGKRSRPKRGEGDRPVCTDGERSEAGRKIGETPREARRGSLDRAGGAAPKNLKN